MRIKALKVVAEKLPLVRDKLDGDFHYLTLKEILEDEGYTHRTLLESLTEEEALNVGRGSTYRLSTLGLDASDGIERAEEAILELEGKRAWESALMEAEGGLTDAALELTPESPAYLQVLQEEEVSLMALMTVPTGNGFLVVQGDYGYINLNYSHKDQEPIGIWVRV